MINWQFYPKSENTSADLLEIVAIFKAHEESMGSLTNKLHSDKACMIIHEDLVRLGFQVEKNKKQESKIQVPVLFGKNGKLEKYFEADAYHKEKKIVLEVEAGRGVTNYQFLKDLFQACLMQGVDYLVIAIRNKYRTSSDFEKVLIFFDSLYASDRLKLPLKGILVIGY